MAEESYHLPIQEKKPKEEPPKPQEKTPEEKAKDDKDIEEMIRKLKKDMAKNGKGGPGGGFKVFKPEDFKDLSPEEMQAKFEL